MLKAGALDQKERVQAWEAMGLWETLRLWLQMLLSPEQC